MRAAWERLRPLDPVRSIKAKFALLIGANLVFTAGVTWYAVVFLHWRVRYGMIVASLLALGLSQLLAHGMTRPLRQMTAAVRELGAGRPAGPISTPITTSSRDEVGELARAFTVMAEELTAVDQQRRQLLADVGHELRTPVAALRAQVENLADGVRPADPAALAEVLAQVERLGDLLTDLLRLAETEGPVTLERRPTPVTELVEPVVAEITAARPGASVSVLVEPPGLVADVDALRMRQVLTNLLDNATRAAGAGGLVQVRAGVLAPAGLVLEVTDDGPGIPPDRWQSVFERFRSEGPRGSGDQDRLDGGTGLGLAIARWAVVLHGGSIAVVPAETGGCRIRVEIPGR